jgi:TonB family protein
MKTGLHNFFLLVILALWALTLQARTATVSGAEDAANVERLAVKRVQPTYPPNAQKYRIEGSVMVQIAAGSDGKVTKAEFVRGNNVFRSVSLDAAKRWEFKTATEGSINFVFKLN